MVDLLPTLDHFDGNTHLLFWIQRKCSTFAVSNASAPRLLTHSTIHRLTFSADDAVARGLIGSTSSASAKIEVWLLANNPMSHRPTHISHTLAWAHLLIDLALIQ